MNSYRLWIEVAIEDEYCDAPKTLDENINAIMNYLNSFPPTTVTSGGWEVLTLTEDGDDK